MNEIMDKLEEINLRLIKLAAKVEALSANGGEA